MKTWLQLLTLLTAALGTGVALADAPRVRIETSAGAFVVELEPERAPLTVRSFLQYVRDGFYENTIFHRIVNGFVIQ